MKLETFLSTLVELDNKELSFLKETISIETVNKGDYFIMSGQTSTKVSFINEGLFKMSMTDSDGNEKIIDFLEPSNFVTDYISFLKQTPTNCNIVALRPSLLESIHLTALQNLYEYSPGFQKIGRLLAEQNFIRFAERIKAQTMPPQERYRLLCEQSAELVQAVPQYMIASYLGVTAEWLSKIRSKR
ncbi:Crp/Fnr family transcriptional regulator [Hymenobacter sp. BT664]|uniref:Crp/Fnr family transcriptional regulator n=1 Tax=Hymenobacter montanus TaxID=2771359 RepID=A0A927BBV0_9BACT|nr:Crp/Fnr family transcriptional regulator [Hymenobacter montanus]MBD2767299.1 Crp/Fnr family transcriptional regulator [Hymenobacter montanus]